VRRSLTIALAAAVVVIAALLAAPRGNAAGLQLTLRTVPALEGVDFSFDGRRYSTPASGVLTLPVAHPGKYRLVALPWRHRDRGIRVSFSRWLDDVFKANRTITIDGTTNLEVGYGISYRVDTSFIDLAGRRIPPARVKSVTLASSLGEKYVLGGGEPKWLVGVRVARRLNGLERTLVRYSVLAVDVEGANVVNQAQQRFYIAQTRALRIRLSLYDAHFSTRDLVLPISIGHAIRLTYPNGRRRDVPLVHGEVTLTSLPRGQYQVKVLTGMGIAPQVPVALSRNQDVPLKVISYGDLAGGFLLFVGMSFGLIAARRPKLRAAMRPRRWLKAVSR
jgi:hypothetical protein